MLTMVMSGPMAERSMMLSYLQRTGADVDEQREINPSHGLPPEGLGWVQATGELAQAEQALSQLPGWALRLHFTTPTCEACKGQTQGPGGSTCLHCLGAGQTNKQLRRVDPMAEIRERLERLEARA